MKAVIAGGTGLIGRVLTEELLARGYQVYILTRQPEHKQSSDQLQYVKWLSENARPEAELQEARIFINLAGEPLNSGRWSDERKRRIISSRLSSTKEMLRIMRNIPVQPDVFINASAIGYYPPSFSDTFTEASQAAGRNFLASTVQLWEEAALQAESIGIRTVLTRFGIILEKSGGALQRMVLPYKWFAGGKIGSGHQWMSWIHIKDAARAIVFAIEHTDISGPVNLTAPAPERMNGFGRTLSKVLHRPHWLSVPKLALQALLGEMSSLVLEGQRVLPEKLLDHDFDFQHPTLQSALEDLLVSKETKQPSAKE